MNQIKTEVLVRSDIDALITSQVKAAYLSICGRVPFGELVAPTPVLACTPAQSAVDISALNPAVAGIISLRVNYTSTQGRRLRRTHIRLMQNYGSTLVAGKPHEYARHGLQLRLFPVPDQAYSLTLLYWMRPAIASPVGSTVLAVPPEWEELVMWEALYRIYGILRRPEDAQALIMPALQPKMRTGKKQYSQDIGIIPRLWNELLLTVDRREGIDEDFSINPRR